MSIVGRVTRIDSFMKWRSGEGWDADLTTEEFVKKLTDPFYDNEAMKVGRAFHKMLELAQPGEYTELESEGYTFELPDGELELPSIRELRCGMAYGELYVSGQVDGLEGLRVDDHKTTKNFNAENYFDGWQWRFYLDIFEADLFRWNVFPVEPAKRREGRSMVEIPGRYIVSPPQIIEQRRYAGLHRDCERAAAAYLEFARQFLPKE